MTKEEYILTQFKKTFNKTYENYCVTRLYTLLNNLDIKIVTQQLFRRDDGKIALADIYFPQLQYIVEIDEPYHKKNKEQDKKRENEIKRNYKINPLDEIIDTPIIIKRIDVDDTITNINLKIDEIVNDINSRIKSLGDKFKVWNNSTSVENIKEVISKGYIEVSDNYEFDTILNVSDLFNMGYNGCQRCGFNTKFEKEGVWCPTLYLDESDYLRYKNNKWINTISLDKKYIFELKKEENDEAIRYGLEKETNFNRYVFAKYKSSSGRMIYKYIGTYILNEELTKKKKTKVWEKVGDKINIKKYFEEE